MKEPSRTVRRLRRILDLASFLTSRPGVTVEETASHLGATSEEVIGDLGTAGGHGTVSGGQIPLDREQPEQLAARLSQRILQYLRIPPETLGKPLLET